MPAWFIARARPLYDGHRRTGVCRACLALIACCCRQLDQPRPFVRAPQHSALDARGTEAIHDLYLESSLGKFQGFLSPCFATDGCNVESWPMRPLPTKGSETRDSIRVRFSFSFYCVAMTRSCMMIPNFGGVIGKFSSTQPFWKVSIRFWQERIPRSRTFGQARLTFSRGCGL